MGGQLGSKQHDFLRLAGQKVDNSVAGTTGDILVYIRDKNDDILYATGTDVPADGTAGFSKGALFVDTDVAAATTGLYVNIGTTSAANFDAVADS